MRELSLAVPTTKDSLPLVSLAVSTTKDPDSLPLLKASCLFWTVSSSSVYEWVGGVGVGGAEAGWQR